MILLILLLLVPVGFLLLPSIHTLVFRLFPPHLGGSHPSPLQRRVVAATTLFLNAIFTLQRWVIPRWWLYEDGGEVVQIFIYPIKSCGAIGVTRWMVNEHGLAYDRQYMMVSGADSGFKSLNHLLNPAMTAVTCSFENGGDAGYYTKGVFRFRYPAGKHPAGSFTLPVEVTPEYLHQHQVGTNPVDHQLYSIPFKAYCLDSLPVEFIENMGLPPNTLLMYSATGKFVKTKSPDPLTFLQPSAEGFRKTLFSDYYPALVFSQADVDLANRKLQSTSVAVTPYTFRGNLLLAGGKSAIAHDEDTWARFSLVRAGEAHVWHVAMKCSRCSSLNIDQGTFNPKIPVTRALAPYRKVEAGSSLFFGVYCIQDDWGYEVAQGDKVVIMGRKVSVAAPLI